MPSWTTTFPWWFLESSPNKAGFIYDLPIMECENQLDSPTSSTTRGHFQKDRRTWHGSDGTGVRCWNWKKKAEIHRKITCFFLMFRVHVATKPNIPELSWDFPTSEGFNRFLPPLKRQFWSSWSLFDTLSGSIARWQIHQNWGTNFVQGFYSMSPFH
jgi:hypothetical protein